MSIEPINQSDLSVFSSKFPRLAAALADNPRIPLNAFKQYERILSRLEALWGSKEGHSYLEELLMTQRTDRKGFSDPVATELIRLHLLHIKQYPLPNHNPYDTFAHMA